MSKSVKKSKRNIVLTILFFIIYVLLGWTIVLPLIATRIILASSFNTRIKHTDAIIDESYYKGLRKTPYKFKSGRNLLNGGLFYYENKKPYKGLVIVSHGIGCGMYNYINRSEYFARKGYLVFGFDMTGCCGSEGVGMIGLQQGTKDLKSAIDFVCTLEETKGLKIFIYGHSWSGYASASVLNYTDSDVVTAVASISGFNAFWDTMRDQGERRVGKMFFMAKPFAYLYSYIKFGKTAGYTGINGINRFGKPVMIIHSTDDPTVPYKLGIISQKEKCTNKKAKFVTYTDRGHTVSRPIEIEAKILDTVKDKENIPIDGRNIFQYYVDNKYRFSTIEDVYAINEDFMDSVEQFFEKAAKEE